MEVAKNKLTPVEDAAENLNTNRAVLIFGLIIAMLFGALDGTIVGTAMPRIVGELVCLAPYSDFLPSSDRRSEDGLLMRPTGDGYFL